MFFLAGGTGKSYSSEVVVVTDSTERIVLMGSKIDILEDPTDTLSITQVSSESFASRFSKPAKEIPTNTNRNASYWIRFTVKNQTKRKKNWAIEFLDFRIDEIDFYEPDGHGNFHVRKEGDSYAFHKKEYDHKNFIFDFELPQKETVYYARMKAAEAVGLFAEIESSNLMLSYSANEYFTLALFYGIVFSLMLFNIFLFVTASDRAYLYFVLYILSVGIYCMSQDGTGFQYLWPNHPGFNNYAPLVAVFSMVFWGLWYARKFLFIESTSPVFNKIILSAIALRSALFLIGLTILPSLLFLPWLDILLMFVAYIAGMVSLKKGYSPAIYYVIGFTFLFTGFLITTLGRIGFINNSLFTVYSYNYGVLIQLFMFAFALAARLKEINKQKELVEEKNKELDTFVYKASHDIKGPLKSIIGLTKVGLQDIKSPEARNYFDLILKNTNRLDSILGDLIMVTKMKQSDSKKVKIDFEGMIREILSSFEYLPSYKEMEFKIHVNQEKEYFSDPMVLYSIIQNLIENGIKYKKPSSPLFHSKEKSFLSIEALVGSKEVLLLFKDNGLGIKKELQEKIFDMFFRVEYNSHGSGLGLYLVKISVEKLGGKIEVESEENKGSLFTVKLPVGN